MQSVFEESWIGKNKEKLTLFFFILLKLVICAFPFEYGYFRDELYYIALSHHLDWGYIDVPPLLPLCIFLLRYTIGNSLFAIHLFSAMTGVVVLAITWMMVKKMGGRLLAQILALVCVTFAPYFITTSAMCNYDCINQVFWALALYFLVALLVSENKKYWIYFGIAAGLGLMSKFDILWLGAGIVIALIFTSQRKYFLCKQFWGGGVIALLIVSPYLIWIVANDFLTIEYFTQYHSQTNPITIFDRFKEQIMDLNFLTFPIWLAGLYYFLFNKTGKKFRLLGIAYFTVLILCTVFHTKFYLNMPCYFVLFAGGAVCIEVFFVKEYKPSLVFSGYIMLIVVLGLIVVPFCRPILPMPVLIKYATFLNIHSAQTERTIKQSNIPQHMIDRFGWEEMAAEFGRIYNSLSEEEKKNAVIVVYNYGEAGAIDFYRQKYNLPPVICGHLQYFLWMPKYLSEKTVSISFGNSIDDLKQKFNGVPVNVLNQVFSWACIDDLEKKFRDIKQAGRTYSKYAIYYENNQPIYLSKGFKIPPKEALQALKNMHM